jgi:omega-amidase
MDFPFNLSRQPGMADRVASAFETPVNPRMKILSYLKLLVAARRATAAAPWLFFGGFFGASLSAAPAPTASDQPGLWRVAAVQLRSVPSLAANSLKIRERLQACAQQGVRLAAFPECALSSYFPAAIKSLSAAQIESAEQAVAAACRQYAINAVVGTAEIRDGRYYNCALCISARGEILARCDKLHLVPADKAWGCTPGSALPPVVFFDRVPVTVVICHDSRYPELFRLPILAGARVVFYISSESPLGEESKLEPYRAQVQARAVENTVFVVHPNAPADDMRTGSHGQSLIVAPDGNLLMPEGSLAREESLVADLDLSLATAAFARRSLEFEPLASWWREEVAQVRIIK